MKNLVALIVATLFAASAGAANLKDGRVIRYATKASLDAASPVEGTVGYAVDTNTSYQRSGSTWMPLDPFSPEYTITFNEGASKGLQGMQSDGTVFDSTAATLNHLVYGHYTLGAMQIVDAGNSVPVADAEGLDITAGNVTDNDHVAYFGGMLGASGRPLVVGTDPAFKMCVTTKIHDVSGTDGYFIGFRTASPVTVAVASYSDYCGFHIVSGDIKVTDKTTGDTDTTDNWTDDQSKALCVLVSSAGACTYTVDGSAPTTTDAHTLGDGILVVPAGQLIHAADGADDTWMASWSVAYQ
jgi:hypothetical protein